MTPPHANTVVHRSHWAFVLLGLVLALRLDAALPSPPDVVYGDLFAAVQRAHVFGDQKTFPDAVPLMPPEEIVRRYEREKTTPNFDLGPFVRSSFVLPELRTLPVPKEPTLTAHIDALWTLLRRSPDQPVPGSSLLPLRNPYIIPGGRFREVYYWDSYFTMLGLRESGQEGLIRSIADNFADELAAFGLIPNGNRTYYLSRSQPPFFALMVEFLAEKNGNAIYRRYLPALEREYAYWMDRSYPTQHVVRMPDGSLLNRYFDRRDTPRPEAFAPDEETARTSSRRASDVYRDLRSAAESGWDFSSRWFGDGKTLGTIETTQIVPVDLNCLLFQLERTLAKARRMAGDASGAAAVDRAADARRAALMRYCWSPADGYFFDYDLHASHPREDWTLAGVVPLFLRLATPAQAAAVADNIRARFLRPGGVVTTLRTTGQQWDAPNGWAPLEWMTIRGLANYGQNPLAAEIAHRWLTLNRDVYARTGKMMEKYNVEDVSLAAGGGEYPSQDGFGWTNGVYLALADLYP